MAVRTNADDGVISLAVDGVHANGTRRPRVVFVLEVRTPYRDQFLDKLATEGPFDLTVLYCTDHEPWRDWQLGDPSYECRTLAGMSGGGRRGGLSLKLNPGVWQALGRLLPDFVVLGGYALPTNQIAMLWCVRNRVPYALLWESHDLDRSALRRCASWVPAKLALGQAAAVFPASSVARRRLRREGVAEDRLALLPNAPDVRRIADAWGSAGGARRNRVEGSPVFLFIGRLMALKGLHTLLSAFERTQRALPGATLVIAGNGPLEDELRTTASNRSLNVSFRGFVQPDEVTQLYQEADAFVLPSERESFGVVVMEAMASGLPVVVSDMVGSGPDLVNERTGMTFPVGDVDRLTDALLTLGRDSERLEAMGRDAAAEVMKWDLDYCVRTFTAVVNRSLRRRPEWHVDGMAAESRID